MSEECSKPDPHTMTFDECVEEIIMGHQANRKRWSEGRAEHSVQARNAGKLVAKVWEIYPDLVEESPSGVLHIAKHVARESGARISQRHVDEVIDRSLVVSWRLSVMKRLDGADYEQTPPAEMVRLVRVYLQFLLNGGVKVASNASPRNAVSELMNGGDAYWNRALTVMANTLAEYEKRWDIDFFDSFLARDMCVILEGFRGATRNESESPPIAAE